MHELSVAVSLIDLVREERARLGGGRVEVIHLRVGHLSSVAPYALRCSFDAAVAGSDLDGAELAIESVPIAIFCDACAREHELTAAPPLACPRCGATRCRIVRGRELELAALELADDPQG